MLTHPDAPCASEGKTLSFDSGALVKGAHALEFAPCCQHDSGSDVLRLRHARPPDSQRCQLCRASVAECYEVTRNEVLTGEFAVTCRRTVSLFWQVSKNLLVGTGRRRP